MASKVAFVVVLPDNKYQRYEGKRRTHFVQADKAFDVGEIQLFRVWPDMLLSPEAPKEA